MTAPHSYGNDLLAAAEAMAATGASAVHIVELIRAHARSSGPEDQAVALLREALCEQRRWRSCQSIGACRQCVDDGVTLRIQTFLDALGATNCEGSK